MQHRFRVLACIAVAAIGVLCLTSSSLAGDRDHTNGFFLRLSAGVGVASTEFDATDIDFKLDGPAGDVNFAIGAIVAPNLALHGTLFGWAITDPDGEFNGVEGSLNGDLTMGAIGAGVTYYIMPANVYLSGSVGFGTLSFDEGDIRVESDAGPAVDITVGKEWWVGRNWGLGVAGGVGFHSVPDGDLDENWTGASFTVRFSATMN